MFYPTARSCRRLLNFTLMVIASHCVMASEVYSSTVDVIRVEEEWEMRVGEPDSDVVGPQIACVISPTGDASQLHAVFNLNHQTLPDFVAGGMQLQIWNGEQPVAHKKIPNQAIINTTNETISWTQVMEVDNGALTFEIRNGSSNTWGNFGGQGYLRVSLTTGLENLNAYNPSLSIDQSGVTFAGNRVQSLILKKVRFVTSIGDQTEVTLNHSVHLSQ